MSQEAKTRYYSLLMPLDILRQLRGPVVHLLRGTVTVGAKVEKLGHHALKPGHFRAVAETNR